jgi:hypothetical protein
MQIKYLNLTIIPLIFLNGCYSETNIYVKTKLKDEKKYNKTKIINKDNFHFNEDEILYINYSKRLSTKTKYKKKSKKEISYTGYLPLMYLQINNINELENIISNIDTIYKTKFDIESKEYLKKHIQKDDVIDLTKRKYTYEEMIQKIVLKYDLTYERIKNTFVIKRYEDKKYYIPLINDKNSYLNKNNVLNSIKKMMTEPTDKNINFDNIGNILYIRDKPYILTKIDEYMKNLKSSIKTEYIIKGYFISFKNKRNDLTWNYIKKELKELNINVHYKNNKIDYKNFISILDKYGDTKLLKTIKLKTISNKTINYNISTEFNYFNTCNNQKKGNTFYNLNVLPIFDKENNLNNISVDIEIKKLINKNQSILNSCSIEKPLYKTIKSNNYFNVKNNDYIIIDNPKIDNNNFLENEELTKLNNSIILLKIEKINNNFKFH